MKLRLFFFTLVMLFILVLTGCSNNTISTDGFVLGTAVDAESGLPFWNGQAKIGGKTAQISGGKFELKNIPPGVHTLTISKLHYKEQKIQINITDKPVTIEVKMQCSYSAADLDLFARLVCAESKGESYTGQVAVAASVLNRVVHRNYPNTLYGVITQRDSRGFAQYSPLDDGSINNPADNSAKDAVRDALVGWDPSLGATGFFAPAKVPNKNNWVWQQRPTLQIGNHLFFKARID